MRYDYSVSRRRLVVGTAVAVVVAAAAFVYALPQFAGYGAVWHATKNAPAKWLLVLAGVTVLDIFTYPLPWRVALPRLGWLDALKMTQASTAFSLVVPGGAPLGMGMSFAMLRSKGFSRADVVTAVTVTGLWSQVSTFIFPVIAMVALAAQGTTSTSLRTAALIGAAISLSAITLVSALLWREAAAVRVGNALARALNGARRFARRSNVSWGGTNVAAHRADLLRLLRRRWIALTIATLANQLTGYVMLDVSVRALGIGRGQLTVTETFAAWSIGRLLGSLPITPGGIGVVELGLTGALVAFGGPRAPVVAAVLLYRAASIFPTLLLGLLAGATWRRGHAESPA